MEHIDRTKIESMLDGLKTQKEQAIAQVHAVGGAIDAINAILAIKPDDKPVNKK